MNPMAKKFIYLNVVIGYCLRNDLLLLTPTKINCNTIRCTCLSAYNQLIWPHDYYPEKSRKGQVVISNLDQENCMSILECSRMRRFCQFTLIFTTFIRHNCHGFNDKFQFSSFIRIFSVLIIISFFVILLSLTLL